MNLEAETCFHRPPNHKPLDWSDAVMRKKLLDGRKDRTPRRVFDKAIAAHCAECWPYQSACHVHGPESVRRELGAHLMEASFVPRRSFR